MFIVDQLGVYDTLREMSTPELNIELVRYDGNVAMLTGEIRGEDTQGFVVLDQAALATRTATIAVYWPCFR